MTITNILTKERRLFALFIIVYIIIIIFLSYIFYKKNIDNDFLEVKTKLIDATKIFSTIIDEKYHDNYSISNPPPQSLYIKKTEELNTISSKIDVIYIYSIIKNNNKYYFTAGNQSADEKKSGNYGYFGEEYNDAPNKEINRALDSGEIIFSKPYKDKWGVFQTIYSPYITPKGNKYLICADIERREIENIFTNSIIEASLFGIIFLLPLLPAFRIYNRYRRERENELINRLYTNEVTSLPNKLKLENELKTYKDSLAIVLMSFNHFELFSNIYDIEANNEMIRNISILLQKNLQSNCKLYHMHEHQFAIVIERPYKEQEKSMLTQIRVFFQHTTVEISGMEVILTFTMGSASSNSTDVLAKAETALIKAINMGNNKYLFFNEKWNDRKDAQEVINWMCKVKKALAEESFVAFFQPIYNVHTTKVEKFECLARLIDGEEIINPYQFLEPARMAGFLPHLTKAIINNSFAYFSNQEYSFSINITADDLEDDNFIQFIQHKLDIYKIETNRVIIEILEDISINNDLIERIKELKLMGLKIAIDDFGTSNSNYSRLMSLDANYIKIDGAFIKNIDIDISSYKIVTSIITLAKTLGIETIAEYVRSKAIMDILVELGVDYVQGYYIGEPVRVIGSLKFDS